MSIFTPKQLTIEFFVALLGVSLAAQSAPPQTTQDALARATWRVSMKHTQPPSKGCYTVIYPNTVWTPVACEAARKEPFLPAHGRPLNTAGNSNDFSAYSYSGTITSSDGSFLTGSGGISENGYVDNNPPAEPNTFSLQLNTNIFSGTPLCGSASDPAQCVGWEQFVYSEGNGQNSSSLIEYWLLNYGPSCPPGWSQQLFSTNCYINSPMVAIPPQQASNIPYMTLSASTSNGIDTVVFENTQHDELYSVDADSVLNLSQLWKSSEFNVFGDAGGAESNLSTGSALVVQTNIDNGTTNPPRCIGPQSGGTTAETNNLNLEPQSGPVCCPYGGNTPSIQFLESNASGAIAACEASQLAVTGGNFAATPYSTNGSITRLTYPIILGQTRTLYSATLNDVTSGASITYQFFDNCGNPQGAPASVSPGTNVSYLLTEINGQPCTYGFHSSMYASAPGYAPSFLTSIIF